MSCCMPRGNVRDDEGPQEADVARFGGDSRPCPSCGVEVYDDAEWCHKCGRVLGGADEPAKATPGWVMAAIAAAVLGLVAAFVM